MGRRHSRSESEMDAQLDTLDPGSPRHQVLAAARAFKAFWVELGERLTLVREGRNFEAWGYASFDAYCRRELRIKQDTANKLTRSFAFLRDHEPGALEGAGGAMPPPLDVVDLLSQAKERTKLSDGALAELQREAFDEQVQPTRNELVKKMREHDPEAFKPPAKQAAALPADTELRKALLLAERLESVLQGQEASVSPQALSSAHSVVAELRERFARLQRQGAA